MGKDLQFSLSHENTAILQAAGEKLVKNLESYESLAEVGTSESQGKEEYRFKLRPEGKAVGLDPSSFATELRASFLGLRAYRINRGRHEVPVMVRYPEESRNDLVDLDRMIVRTATGAEIALPDAASITTARSPNQIERVNNKRVLQVFATLVDKSLDAGSLSNQIKNGFIQELLQLYPGLSVSEGGSQEQRMKSTYSLVFNFLIGLGIIFALLALLFKSYTQPLLIMFAVPFGISGAVWGHWLLGHPLSFLSFFGIVGLTGVVVNDSLILIDSINQKSLQGVSLREAIVESSKLRFRPILLTSMTTFIGLMPMLLERSRQAQYLIPMAISIGMGILAATVITLIILPCLYLIWFEGVSRGSKTHTARE